jgi:hypothetical protein
MNTVTTFSQKNIDIFKSFVGKQFDKFKCDPFICSPMVYGVVAVYIGGEAYKITSLFETVKRFFGNDDVAVFRIEQTDGDKIKTYMDEGEFIETPVNAKIVAVDIVTDHQSVEHDGKIQPFDYTVGVVFHLEDSREISFEIKTWFSEMITVERGYNLIEKFTSVDDFLEEWEGCDNYSAESSREIITFR